MTALYILDTDHITLLQRNHPAVISRFASLPPEVVAVTVVSAMEQMRGRLAQIHRAKTAPEVVNAFARFQEALHFIGRYPYCRMTKLLQPTLSACVKSRHIVRARKTSASLQLPAVAERR
jgi:hypothetical protein